MDRWVGTLVIRKERESMSSELEDRRGEQDTAVETLSQEGRRMVHDGGRKVLGVSRREGKEEREEEVMMEGRSRHDCNRKTLI